MKMMFTKLKVFMLLAVCACGLGAKAGTATVDFAQQGYTNAQVISEITSGNVTFKFQKGTGSTDPAYYTTGTAVRLYANNTLTVSVPANATLSTVVFTFASGGSYAPTSNPATTGTYSNNTWTAGASDGNSIEFTRPSGKGHWRIQKIVVTYTTGGGEIPTVAAPEISLPTGNYVGEQTVTITAEEGASVYYTTNGDAPTAESTEYMAPITVSETTTIKAIAVKDGESSNVATSVITIVPEVTTIAEFNQIGEGNIAALTLTNAVVTGKNATNVYVQDATGGLIFYSPAPTCNLGDKVSGTIVGKYKAYRNAHELIEGDFTNATFTAGGVISPIEVTLSELNANPDAYHMLLVKVAECTYESDNICQGTDKVKFYDGLKLIPANYSWPSIFNFTGIFLNDLGTTPELVVRDVSEIENVSSLEVPEFAWSATSVVYDMNNPTDLPTLTNTSDATPVYTSSNEAVATVAADGKITIIGEGKTTITAEVAATENYSAATASFTLEVVNTEAQGDAVAFVAIYGDVAYAMSTASSKSNTLDAVAAQTVNGKVINAANQAGLSWYVDKAAGTIQTASGAYLTATSAKTNLSTATTKCVWTWDDAEGIFVQGTRSFFYSEGTGFKNYATSNKNNKGFSGLSQMMTFADGHVRTGLTAEDWGTICLPNAVAAGDVTGADFYPVAGKVVTDGKVTAIVLGEAVTTLEAGVPYVFSAKESSLLAAYNGEAVSAPVAANGLTGTLAAINADKNAEDTELSGKYMLVGNTWRLCGKGCSLAANRAYLDMDAVPSLAAGSYALTMSVFDDGATGIESVDATASAPVDVYTVSGVRVRASVSSAQATEGLQKGLYIINGKKVLVK
ncbi:MAG: chitobiase/beta-hexosaminidase C-terminal domain-containing protein [Paraprevotella sp.]|nr:chitobiase/beta-hexosaminidase C-terminal domain-containing protein [Paraprevotella sp.]